MMVLRTSALFLFIAMLLVQCSRWQRPEVELLFDAPESLFDRPITIEVKRILSGKREVQRTHSEPTPLRFDLPEHGIYQVTLRRLGALSAEFGLIVTPQTPRSRITISSIVSGDKLSFLFNSTSPYQEEFNEAYEWIAERRLQFAAHMRQLERQGKKPTAEGYDWPTRLEEVRLKIDESSDIVLRELYYMNYFDMLLQGAASNDTTLAIRALTEIHPENELWAIQPFLAVAAMDLTQRADDFEEYGAKMAYNHPNATVQSTLAYYLLTRTYKTERFEAAKRYFDLLLTRHPNTQYAQWASAEYSPYNTIVPGRTVPDFSLNDIDFPVKYISRDELVGTAYLIDFWATWCGPCLEEMENLHTVYETFKGRNFEIISISLDETVEDVLNFRQKKWPMPWRHAFLKGGFRHPMAKAFEVDGIPKPILVDAKGKILATGIQLRGDYLMETLERRLK